MNPTSGNVDSRGQTESRQHSRGVDWQSPGLENSPDRGSRSREAIRTSAAETRPRNSRAFVIFVSALIGSTASNSRIKRKTLPRPFRGGIYLTTSSAKNTQSHFVIVLQRRKHQHGGDLDGVVHLADALRTKDPRCGDVDDQHDRQFAFFAERFDIWHAGACRDVPVDRTNFVAGYLFADGIEFHTAPLKRTQVFTRQKVVDLLSSDDLNAPNSFSTSSISRAGMADLTERAPIQGLCERHRPVSSIRLRLRMSESRDVVRRRARCLSRPEASHSRVLARKALARAARHRLIEARGDAPYSISGLIAFNLKSSGRRVAATTSKT